MTREAEQSADPTYLTPDRLAAELTAQWATAQWLTAPAAEE